VPLIARYGDRFQPGVETGLAQCHDVYPTILELAGIPWEPRPGETCQSLLRPIPDSRIGISEYATPDFGPLNRFSRDNPNIDCSRFARPLKAIQRGNMKLVCAAGSAPELYNLAGDPLETRDLADQDPASARELYAALERWEGSFDHFVAKADKSGIKKYGFTESEIQTMRGMGYIQSGDVSGKKKDDVSGKQ
jgi:arylsulfatase A-like enzyme